MSILKTELSEKGESSVASSGRRRASPNAKPAKQIKVQPEAESSSSSSDSDSDSSGSESPSSNEDKKEVPDFTSFGLSSGFAKHRSKKKLSQSGFLYPFTVDAKCKPSHCRFPLIFDHGTEILDPVFKTPSRNGGGEIPGIFFDQAMYLREREKLTNVKQTVPEAYGVKTEPECDIDLDLSIDKVVSIDVEFENQDDLFADVDITGLLFQRPSPLLGLALDVDVSPFLNLDEENSCSVDHMERMTRKLLWIILIEDEQTFHLNLIKLNCGKVTEMFTLRDDSALFAAICRYAHLVGVNDSTLKFINYFDSSFGHGFPCAEHIRFQKARFMLKFKIFNGELTQSLSKRLSCSMFCEAEERKLWSVRLKAAIGAIRYMQILNLRGDLPSLTSDEFTPDSISTETEIQLEFASEAFQQFFQEFEQVSNGGLDVDFGDEDLSTFLFYFVDLKRFQGLKHEAIDIVELFVTSNPANNFAVEMLDDLKNDRILRRY